MELFVVESGSLSHLRRAVLLLVGSGPVKQRLCEATVRHLLDVNPAELPAELAATYRELMASLRSTQAIGGMGPVEATIRKMSDHDAAACAARVLDLYLEMSGARLGRDAREHAAGSPRQLRLVGDD